MISFLKKQVTFQSWSKVIKLYKKYFYKLHASLKLKKKNFWAFWVN